MSKSQIEIDYWMLRVIRSAENEMVPVRSLLRTMFGKALAPLERGSPAARLELNQGSEQRRYFNLSMQLIELIWRIGGNLVMGFGGRNRSKEGRFTWICSRR